MSAKWLGVKRVKLDTIVLPGGFAKRKKEPHVRQLAESIEREGVISLPVIDAKSRKLVAGGDRLAALQLLQVSMHEVRLVEGTPAELECITLAENLRRRRGDDYDAMTARMVELQRDEQAADEDELPVSLAENSESKRGRPQTEVGAAREAVAAKLGKTPEAIRSAEKRAKAKEREQEEAKVPEAQRLADNPPVTTYGVAMDAELASDVRGVQVVIGAADSLLRKAQGTLSSLKDMGALGAALYGHIQADMHRAADAVRRELPGSICPCCKLLPGKRPACTFCGGLGVVSNMKLATVAPELLASGDKAMVLDGRGGFVPYAREVGKAAAPAKPAKKLQVTGPDGKPVNLDDDDGLPF